MLRFSLLLLLYIVSLGLFAVQKCDNDSDDDDGSIFDWLSLFISDDEDEKGKQNEEESEISILSFPMPDSLRSEQFEVRYSTNILAPNGIADFVPIGFEAGVYASLSETPGLYLGGITSIYSYGIYSYDSLMGEYDKITTSYNIYSIGIQAKQQIVNQNDFKAYVGLETGIVFFRTNVWAKDEPEPCECEEPAKMLKRWSNVSPMFGPILDLQFPTHSMYDRFHVQIGYQMMGTTRYIKSGNVEISPYRIKFSESQEQLNMFSFRVGFSHYF